MAKWVWTPDDTDSDLVFGGTEFFNRRMLRYPENAGTFTVTVPVGTTEGGFFYSPANQPGSDRWPGGQAWRAQVHVAVANPNIELQIGLARLTGAGTFVELYADTTAGQSLGTTGVKLFVGTTLEQTTAPLPTTGDRLRVLYRFTRNAAKGVNDVTLGFGDPDRDLIEAPILMGNPAILWNGNTLAFPGPLTDYKRPEDLDRDQDFSGGGVAATILHRRSDEIRIALANFEDAAFEADLVAWWAWAVQGKQYAFALDSANVVNLALNGAAAAGQKDIPLADTSSVVVGRQYRLREAAGPEEEIIQVDSVVTNVKAVALNNLRYGYLTGDIFRSRDYYPKVVAPNQPRPWEQIITTWSMEHRMVEDRG